MKTPSRCSGRILENTPPGAVRESRFGSRAGDGSLSVRELLRGLNKVGAFRALDEDDVEALIRREFDSDRNGTVELDEFVALVEKMQQQ